MSSSSCPSSSWSCSCNYFLLVLLVSSCLALPQYNLPAGADELLTDPINTDFNCENRNYGYFADVNNNCQLFHICLPIQNEAGEVVDTNQWTFVCANGTVFDQQTLTCNYASDSFPCEDSELLYDTVQFGVTDTEPLRI